MKKLILVSLIAMFSLILTRGYCGQKSQWESIDWTIIYTADTMPDKANPPWSLHAKPGYTKTANGIATVDTFSSDADVQHGWKMSWDASASIPIIIEVRLKVYEADTAAVYLDFPNGLYFGSICFMTDTIRVSSANKTQYFPMDTSDDFHTYRIIRSGRNVELYVDGDKKPALGVEADEDSPKTKRNRIFFGDGDRASDGKADWDYIKLKFKK